MNSVFDAIDELHRLSKLSSDEVSRFKEEYECISSVTELTKDIKQKRKQSLKRQHNSILRSQIELERLRSTLKSEQEELKLLNVEYETTQRQLDDCQERETAGKYEISELEHLHQDTTRRVAQMRQTNHQLVDPTLSSLKKEIHSIEITLKTIEDSFDRDTGRKHSLLNEFTNLGKTSSEAGASVRRANEILHKVTAEPDRIRKQKDCIQRASDKLRSEISKVIGDNQSLEVSIKEQLLKCRQAEEVRNNIIHKLEVHHDTLLHRHRDVEIVKKNIEVENARNRQVLESKASLVLALSHSSVQARHEGDKMVVSKKLIEALKSKCRKKQRIADALHETIPLLQAQLADDQHSLASRLSESAEYRTQSSALKNAINLSIAKLLQYEKLGQDKRNNLESLLRVVAGMEDDIATWSAEERRQRKLISALHAQREIKARDATRSRVAERDTKEQVKVKELILFDLTKKYTELNNRLKEFSALYDVVKNERNKYVNLMQSSSQALAEMKEKLKILINEVEILRVESKTKTKVLLKERSQHTASQAHRDGLRLDLHKSNMHHYKKQEVIEQQIIEIRRLNTTIDTLEKDMLRIKNDFERAVEMRNSTGISIIDRNDELCVLYEKKHLQEDSLRKGELGVYRKQEEARTLRLQLAEIQRMLLLAKGALPRLQKMATTITNLQKDLEVQRHLSSSICLELESPSNLERWRFISGHDHDNDELSSKVVVLESVLGQRKERVLESELILEEMVQLTIKMKDTTGTKRQAACVLARQMAVVQAKLCTRKRETCALLSELSLYQAASSNLCHQHEIVAASVQTARLLAAKGQPPFEEAELELRRRRYEISTGLHAASTAEQSTIIQRTAAQARPKAYVPDSLLGTPKPYGALAPFKPTKPGATMRHTRIPHATDIIEL